jgi:hypothetical protein
MFGETPKLSGRDLYDEISLEGGTRLWPHSNSKKAAGPERVNDIVEGRKTSKGKPHERNRDEISSAGHRGSKTSRG